MRVILWSIFVVGLLLAGLRVLANVIWPDPPPPRDGHEENSKVGALLEGAVAWITLRMSNLVQLVRQLRQEFLK